MLACEYEAVRHLLTAPRLAARTRPFIGADDFDFAGLASETETMSGGEEILVRVAQELWLAEKRVGLWELVRRLDHESFVRVLEALRIGRRSHGQSSASFDVAA
jgi:hypothetical protein